jgi:hypothetical protein
LISFSDAGGGWVSNVILKEKVKNLELIQDKQGRISIALTVFDASQKFTSLRAAVLLANNTDFSKLDQLLVPVAKVDGKFVSEKIILGSSDNNQAPLIVCIGKIGELMHYYICADIHAGAKALELPENARGSVLDLSLGFVIGYPAVFFLYELGSTRTLMAKTVTADEFGAYHQWDYSPGID